MPDDEIEVMVAVTDEELPAFAQVLKRLREAGLQLTSEQPAAGTVTGRIAGSRVAGLAALRGVAAVERAGEYQLPAPDAGLQ